jgi:hypothetical protein
VSFPARVLALALLVIPATATAQVSPTAPVHPSMPWSGITTPHGQLLRYIYVPPQPMTLEYVVTGPPDTPPPVAEAAPPTGEGEAKSGDAPALEPTPPSESPAPPPRILRQEVTVPGYYVRETTVGFHYPERWTIEPAGPNVYRWRQLPAQFISK